MLVATKIHSYQVVGQHIHAIIYAQLTALLFLRLKNSHIIVLQKHDKKTHFYQAAGQHINVMMQYAPKYGSIAAVPIEEFSELYN